MPKINSEFKNPLDNPEEANREISELLKETSTDDRPVIEYPPSDLVYLPGGYVDDKGEVHSTAQIRELNGEDEEAMAKAAASTNPVHFINTILERGTVQIGSLPPEKTREILPDMLIGDREQVFIGIREATYGKAVKKTGWICFSCGHQTDVTFELDADVAVRKLSDPATEIEFDVPLRKGGKVRARLATGRDQTALFDKDAKLNRAQADTKLLSMCIIRLTDEKNVELATAFMPSLPLRLGLMDRKRILKELVERQPGPQLNDIKFSCESCGEEVSLAIGLEELFLNFELLSGV